MTHIRLYFCLFIVNHCLFINNAVFAVQSLYEFKMLSDARNCMFRLVCTLSFGVLSWFKREPASSPITKPSVRTELYYIFNKEI